MLLGEFSWAGRAKRALLAEVEEGGGTGIGVAEEEEEAEAEAEEEEGWTLCSGRARLFTMGESTTLRVKRPEDELSDAEEQDEGCLGISSHRMVR